MAFPSTPTIGDSHIEGGIQYLWDGDVWVFQGQVGPQGKRAGAEYTFSTTTTAGDPGSGFLRYNNASIASVTAIYIDNVDVIGNNISALLDTFNGTLIIKNQPGTLLNVFNLVSIVDSGGYRTITVTYVSGSLPANETALYVDTLGVGANGAQGIQGRQGITGIQGSLGIQGSTGAGTQGVQGIQGGLGTQGGLGSGSQGITGSQGATGTQGTQGVQGVIGSQGITGIQGAQGTQGSIGAQGTQGRQGTTGSQGITGSQGTQGTTGSTGTQGAQGTQGITGSQGTTGSTGTQGTQGTTGSTGSQGTQGITGSQGTQGITGSTGSQGTQGITGSTGSQGTQGITGSQGIQGRQGTTGIDGAQGTQGRQGTTGNTGSQGTQGITGSTGIQGTQGITGSTGSQGTQGTTGSTGAQGTQGTTGNTGSQGTQGITGSTGIQGTQGTTGNTGSQGTQGITGSQGTQGITGSQGTQGITGSTGSQGIQGTTGNTGSQGTQGITGSTGTQGTQGITGSQGTQGRQGTTGIDGAQGTQGRQGTTGNTGSQGTQGTTGSTGTQGTQGITGSQGTQGRQGTTGNTGSQGTQGTTGNTGSQGTQGTTGSTGAQGTQGISGAAILGSANTWTNVNTWETTAPDLRLRDSDAGTDAKIWRNYNYTNGALGWSIVNDAFTVESFWLTVVRTAHTSAVVNIPGSATFTINTNTNWHAGNDGAGSTLDADLLDGLNSTAFMILANQGQRLSTTSGIDVSAGTAPGGSGNSALEIFQATAGADAYFTFHISGDYAVHFGLDGGTNDLFVGGWSMGTSTANKIWHAGNDGAGSGLDADLLDGFNLDTAANANTVVRRDASGHISGVYFFGQYINTTDDTTSAPITYVMAKMGDNYHRSADANKVRAFLAGQCAGAAIGFSNWNTEFQATGLSQRRWSGDTSGSTNGPGGTWWFADNMRHYNGTNFWGTQIAWGWEDNANRLKQRNIVAGSYSAWVSYWNDANDGAGSGLDSDLFDGLNSTEYVFGASGGYATTGNVTNMNTASKSGFYTADNPTNGPFATWTQWINVRGAFWADGSQYVNQLAWNMFSSDMRTRNCSGGTWGSWFKVWNETNDGSGSGLDADLWDGNNFATYLNQAVLTTSSPTFANWTITSDRQTKSNEAPFSNALSYIKKLQAKTFTSLITGEEHLGFVAQDVQQAGVPHAVSEKNGMLSISPTALNAVAIEAIKELEEKVKALEELVRKLLNGTASIG